MTNIIKCKFIDGEGNPRGREYSYYTNIPVSVGMMVDVPAPPQSSVEKSQTKRVIVTAVDVPEAEIEAFKDSVKTIVGIHKEIE